MFSFISVCITKYLQRAHCYMRQALSVLVLQEFQSIENPCLQADTSIERKINSLPNNFKAVCMLEKIKLCGQCSEQGSRTQNEFHKMREQMQVWKQEVWRNGLQLQVREKKMRAIASAKGVPEGKSFYYKPSKIKNKQKNKSFSTILKDQFKKTRLNKFSSC